MIVLGAATAEGVSGYLPGNPDPRRRRRTPLRTTDALPAWFGGRCVAARRGCLGCPQRVPHRMRGLEWLTSLRRDSCEDVGLHLWSCLVALPALRGRLRRRRRRQQAGGGGGARRPTAAEPQRSVTIYSSLPLQGASRPQSEDVIKGIEARAQGAGDKAGDFTIKYESLDDATAAAGKWDAGPDKGQRPQGRAGRHDDRLHRRVQLGRVGELDPDAQRGRHPAGLPVEHGARPDQGRRRRRARRAGQVLPDRQSAPTAASSRSTRSRAPRRPST